MARGFVVRFGEEESTFAMSKIDREKLYGLRRAPGGRRGRQGLQRGLLDGRWYRAHPLAVRRISIPTRPSTWWTAASWSAWTRLVRACS